MGFAPVDAAFDKFAGKAIGKKEAIQIVNKHLVKGTIYSVGLIGHTYDTLSGATIDTEALQNQEDTYIVKEGDHTAKILEFNQQDHISQTRLCANESSKNRVNRTTTATLL